MKSRYIAPHDLHLPSLESENRPVCDAPLTPQLMTTMMETTTIATITASSTPSLSHLPDELLLQILTYLDIPDLLTTTRLSTHLRTLSLDPLLHSSRLHRASCTLERAIPLRPSLADLIAHRIYITRTTLAARNLGRSLIGIRLNRRLKDRPSVDVLIEKGVLPGECYGKGNGWGGGSLSPGLVERKRRVERERVKDGLRGWVGEWRRRGREMREKEEEEATPDVRWLVRRFGRREEGGRMERRAERQREAPTRAKVLGLRRFWERVGRDEGVGS